MDCLRLFNVRTFTFLHGNGEGEKQLGLMNASGKYALYLKGTVYHLMIQRENRDTVAVSQNADTSACGLNQCLDFPYLEQGPSK